MVRPANDFPRWNKFDATGFLIPLFNDPRRCGRPWRSVALATSAQEVQSRPNVQRAVNADSKRSQSIGTIDTSTRWAFRTVSPVFIPSSIVRLGDVVQPLNPNMAGWQRLKRSPIGLLPLGSEPMTIQRTRLERAILDAEATPLAIDWIGPREIEVAYRAPDPSSDVTIAHVAATGAAPALHAKTWPLRSYRSPTWAMGLSPFRPATSRPAAEPTSQQPTSHKPTGPVSLAEADRIIQWVLLALDRSHPEVAQEFRVEVPRDQAAFASLVGIAGVNDIAPIETITEGNCRFQLTARSTGGPIDTELLHVPDAASQGRDDSPGPAEGASSQQPRLGNDAHS